ncbi:hypothetical protein HDU81_005027 [Chytriomyces hyalinus]|nr:hypothetical protein HDU81_005027 [Chytriomyces hyalinus]
MSHRNSNNNYKRDSSKLDELLDQLDETLTAFAPSLLGVQEVDESYDDLLNDYALEPANCDTATSLSVSDSISTASQPTSPHQDHHAIQHATVSLLHQQMQQSKSPILARNSIAATWDKPDKQQPEISNNNRISSASSPAPASSESRGRYAYAPIMSPELHSLRVQLENAKKELGNQQNANRLLLKQQEAASFARYNANQMQQQQPPLPFGSPSSLDTHTPITTTTMESTSLPSVSVLHSKSLSPSASRQSIGSIASVASDSKSLGMSSVGRSKSTASGASVGKKKSKNAALLRMQLGAAGI